MIQKVPLKVLVVDDEEDIRFLFEQQFKEEIKEEKIIFYYASNSEEALTKLDQGLKTQFLLILSDINMPGMNGLELLKLVKERYPLMTIFMITAYGDPHNCQLAWDYGAQEIINKPINFTRLRHLMDEFEHLHKLEG